MERQRIRVSEQMQGILSFVAEREWAATWHVVRHVYSHESKPRGRGNKQAANWKPLTGSQRASVSRSVKRLLALGYLQRTKGNCLVATQEGVKWLAERM